MTCSALTSVRGHPPTNIIGRDSGVLDSIGKYWSRVDSAPAISKYRTHIKSFKSPNSELKLCAGWERSRAWRARDMVSWVGYLPGVHKALRFTALYKSRSVAKSLHSQHSENSGRTWGTQCLPRLQKFTSSKPVSLAPLLCKKKTLWQAVQEWVAEPTCCLQSLRFIISVSAPGRHFFFYCSVCVSTLRTQLLPFYRKMPFRVSNPRGHFRYDPWGLKLDPSCLQSPFFSHNLSNL